jgi:hypothetical protein
MTDDDPGVGRHGSLYARPVVAAVTRQVDVDFDPGAAAFFGGIKLEFGDGEQAFVCMPGARCRASSVNHRYAAAGRYVLRLVGVGEGGDQVLATRTINVD